MTNKKGQHTANNYFLVLNSMELGNPVILLSVFGHLLSIRGFKYLYTTTQPQGINDSNSNSNLNTESNFSFRQ